MKIESIELRRITLPLVSPFTTSFGTQSERPCIIVSVHVEGVTGYGECVAMEGPWYSSETVGTAWHVLQDYLPTFCANGQKAGVIGRVVVVEQGRQ